MKPKSKHLSQSVPLQPQSVSAVLHALASAIVARAAKMQMAKFRDEV